jgi:hypothetical protein
LGDLGEIGKELGADVDSHRHPPASGEAVTIAAPYLYQIG